MEGIFSKSFKLPTASESHLNLKERTDDHDEIHPPSYNEICSIINKLKQTKLQEWTT